MSKLVPLLTTGLGRLTGRPAGPLGLLWLAAQAWALRHGPVEVYDSARYLHHAALLATGHGADATAHNARYVGYALYLSFFTRWNMGLWAPVLGQVLITGLATIACFRTVRRIARGVAWPAPVVTAAVLVWPDLQRFSAYILTESLFASAVMLASWALARAAYSPRRHLGRWLVVALALTAVTLARPNGFLVPAAAVVAGLAGAWRRAGAGGRLALVLGSAIATAAAGPALNAAAHTYHLMETYARGHIISGYTGWLVRPTAPLLIPSAALPQLQRVAAFAAAQPGYFARLAGAKVLAFVAYVKPFWSAGHVVLAAVVLWPAWVLAARGLRNEAVPVGARWFAGALLASQAAVVALTVEDWDARFLTPLLPIVFGLAALGLADRRDRPSRALPPPEPAGPAD
ncbi:MAG: hypothetical protein H7330_02330 [Hymenobacteraceae bacterium]|nr:hypothetical protein [Hymenobacteraceae bacterium]